MAIFGTDYDKGKYSGKPKNALKDFFSAIKKGEKAGYDSRSAEYNLVRTFKTECMGGGAKSDSTTDGISETFMIDGETYQGKSVKGTISDVKVWQVA